MKEKLKVGDKVKVLVDFNFPEVKIEKNSFIKIAAISDNDLFIYFNSGHIYNGIPSNKVKKE